MLLIEGQGPAVLPEGPDEDLPAAQLPGPPLPEGQQTPADPAALGRRDQIDPPDLQGGGPIPVRRVPYGQQAQDPSLLLPDVLLQPAGGKVPLQAPRSLRAPLGAEQVRVHIVSVYGAPAVVDKVRREIKISLC